MSRTLPAKPPAKFTFIFRRIPGCVQVIMREGGTINVVGTMTVPLASLQDAILLPEFWNDSPFANLSEYEKKNLVAKLADLHNEVQAQTSQPNHAKHQKR